MPSSVDCGSFFPPFVPARSSPSPSRRSELGMKHGISLRKLGRDRGHRRALLRNQVTSLIEHERIETTVAKAKELRRVADRMINHAKKGTHHAHIAVRAYLQTKESVAKLMNVIGPRFENRPGGYTRVLKTRHRRGDCAPMAVVELSETNRSILSPEQLKAKEMRKTKYNRGRVSPPSLANALPSDDEIPALRPLDPAGRQL